MNTSKTPTAVRWIIAAAVVLMLTYGGLWFALGQNLRSLSADWIAEQQRAGWAIAIEDVQLTGFPTWPNVVIKQVDVTAPPQDGGWSWSADGLTLIPETIDLTRFTVRAPGRHEVSALWTPPGNRDARWALEASRFDFEFEIDDAGRLQHGRIHLGDAEVTDPNALPWIGAARVDVALSLTSDDIAADETFAQFRGAADAVRMAIDLPPFERVVRTVQLDADLVGPIQPGRLSDALDAWRRGGGTLEVRRILLDWPPLALAGDGTVALDERLQPIAALSTRITGFSETLRTLETRGLIPPGQAASALVILNLLSNTPRGSDRPELSVPVSVQDLRLSVGPFDVMDVPEVVWE